MGKENDLLQTTTRYEIGPYFFLETSSKHFVKKFIPLEVYIELTKAKHEEYDKEKW